MEISVRAEVNKTIEVDVSIEDVIEGINGLRIESRWNYIAKLLNGISTEDMSFLDESTKEVVVTYLKRKLSKFEKK